MNITQMLLTPNIYSRPQTPLKKVTKIVVHYVGNPNSSAKNNRDYFNNAPKHKTKVSSHYIVGLEGEVIQCIPENEIAYCSNQANSYSISIETCHPDKTGKFNAVTEMALIALVADICKRHKLNPQTDVIRHYDVTGKKCPLWYVTHEGHWQVFKNNVQSVVRAANVKYAVEVFSFSTYEKARDLQSALKLMNLNSVVRTMSDGKFLVSIEHFGKKERAEEILNAVKLLTGFYGEVKVK